MCANLFKKLSPNAAGREIKLRRLRYIIIAACGLPAMMLDQDEPN